MKITFKTLQLLFILVAVQLQGQVFQKAYGRFQPDQQEIRSIVPGEQKSLYGSGTFRNYTFFPTLNFHGSLSKLDSTGQVQWYKAYLPSDAEAFDALFINSLFQVDTTLYGFGHFLGGNVQRTGYMLINFSRNGNVKWAKFLKDELGDEFAKAVRAGNFIYATMRDRIVKFDLQGNVQKMIQYKAGIVNNNSITFRDIYVNKKNQVVVTGDMIWNLNGLTKTPLFIFDTNLQLLSARNYWPANDGAYGTSLCEGPDHSMIIGGATGETLCVDSLGQVKWARRFQQEVNLVDSSLNHISHFVDIKPLNAQHSQLMVAVEGEFYNNVDFQFYAVVARLDGNGNFSEFRVIRKAPFAGSSNFNTYALEVVPTQNRFYLAGSLRDAASTKHLNYLHYSKILNAGCGEERKVPVISTITANYLSEELPDTLVVVDTIQAYDRSFTMQNISTEYDTSFCMPGTDLNLVNVLESGTSEQALLVYPNPGSDQIWINLTETSGTWHLTLRSLDGKVVLVQELEGKVPVNVSALSQGIYLAEIENGSQHYSTKLVIQR